MEFINSLNELPGVRFEMTELAHVSDSKGRYPLGYEVFLSVEASVISTPKEAVQLLLQRLEAFIAKAKPIVESG